MKAPPTFTSRIGPLMARYVAVKRALGRRADQIAYILRRLDRFLVSARADDLTRDTFGAWNATMGSVTACTRRTRLRVVYHFCLFRRREDPRSFVPDPMDFPPPSPRPLPYIYSEDDIARLLETAERLTPHKGSPLHREVARISIVVLYTTGLRRGELVRLTLSDYDATARVLRIRETKFDKSRLVPISVDTALELDRYLTARRGLGAPGHGDAPLLVHAHGEWCRGYTGGGCSQLLRKIIRAAGIRTARGRCPRIHDLRFTFAAHALLRWYRAGVDVQARLPALSTYLGHVSVVSTQYYLTFLRATAEAASERFHTHCSQWLSAATFQGGRP